MEAHKSAVSSCKFTKDGNYMLSGSYDSQIMIWKLPDLLCAGSIMNIESEIKSISISSDSQYFAAIGNEEMAYIYSIEHCLAGFLYISIKREK